MKSDSKKSKWLRQIEAIVTHREADNLDPLLDSFGLEPAAWLGTP